MSYMIAVPDMLSSAAGDLASIGSSINASTRAAAAATTRLLPAAADEVSAHIAALFSGHGEGYQAIARQMAAFHDQFTLALTSSAGAYASAEATNVEQQVLGLINAPTQALWGRPLIGNGADGTAANPNGGAGGLLYGNGGNGFSQTTAGLTGGTGGSAGLIGNGGNGLLVNAKTLLAAFKQRSQALRILLTNVSEASAQVSGLITDNPNLNHVLAQLRTVSEELVKRKNELADVAVLLGRYTAALTEAVGSGPFFKAMVVNLLPYQILQPWVDAAFKKRGIDPENFWRSAGLPEFRWPDPNGTRFPNGAPPAAPPVREGTPKHPGPAVPPGTPCSYTPAAGALPRPDNPLPCAGATVGPFGGPDFPAPLDVQPSPPNPDGPPPTPGILSAGRPGEPAPAVPGIPMPLPPNAPPGARTQPLEPFPDGTGGSNQ